MAKTDQIYNKGIRILTEKESMKVDLGPLTKLKGKWEGKPNMGWNVISVPGPNPPPDGFVLEVIPYKETLKFSSTVVLADNRGPFPGTSEDTQQIVGLMYQQEIRSVCTTARCNDRGFPNGSMIHAERGFFLWIKVDADNPPFKLIRLSTIPHGNSVLVTGNSNVGVPPNNNFIAANSILPTDPAGVVIDGYGLDQFSAQQFPGEFDQLDPNSFLTKTLGNEKITDMTTLIFSTKNTDSGILNIPFLSQHVTAKNFDAIFWIETLKKGGGIDHLQLQYTQTIGLQFPPTGRPAEQVIWPHVTINTLQKVSDHSN
jgi:hypothetical protein